MESSTILDKVLYHLRQEIYVCWFEQVKGKGRCKKDPMKFSSNQKKIFQDNRPDPIQSYEILKEFYGSLISSGNDPTVLQTRSYEILRYPIASYKIVQDFIGCVWLLKQA